MRIDSRLVGATAEHIFLSLLNQRGVFAHSFDTAGFDGIAFDIENRYFRVGISPFYLQIKCRGSDDAEPHPQGHNQAIFDRMHQMAVELCIPMSSLYFVAGFFKNRDIRDIEFFIIPFTSLGPFDRRDEGHYRFSVGFCQKVMQADVNITVL